MGCKTPYLLINSSSPEVLALQNKTGETALMQSIDKGYPCSDGLKLLAQKSAGLDLVGRNGNTALHYVLMKIKRDLDSDREVFPADLALLRVLRNRGASITLANKLSITPSQLLRDLQEKGCKCN